MFGVLTIYKTLGALGTLRSCFGSSFFILLLVRTSIERSSIQALSNVLQEPR